MNVELSRLIFLKAIVVTLPFGWVDLLPLPYTSLTFVLMYCYFAAVAMKFPRSLSIGAVRDYGVLLFGMWFVMFLRTQFDGGLTAFGSWSQLRQIIFFSAFFVLAVPDVARMAAKGQTMERYYLIAMVGMVIAYWSGFVDVHANTSRVSLEGLNPNVVGLYAATSVIVFLDILFRGRKSGFGRNWSLVAIPAIVVMLFIINQTGSRGGILILATSVMIYLIGWDRLTRKQFLSLLFVMPAVLAGIWLVMVTGSIAERLNTVANDIRIVHLWPAAIELVAQQPLFGVGFDRTTLIISDRVGFHISLHNEYLKVLTASGLVGLILFLAFLLKLFRQALLYRESSGSALRLAVLAIMILQLGKGGGAMHLAFTWLMFLLLAAPAPPLLARRSNVGHQVNASSTILPIRTSRFELTRNC